MGRPRTIELVWNPDWLKTLEVAATQVLAQHPDTFLERDDLVSIGWMDYQGKQPITNKANWRFIKYNMHRACIRADTRKGLGSIDIKDDQNTNIPMYEDNHDTIDIEYALDRFTKKERTVLLCRAHGQTFKEIGEHLGVTNERARQIYQGATC